MPNLASDALPTPKTVPETRSLVGRERELGAVTTLLDNVRENGSALLVRGEAGIGKSSLLGAAAVVARGRGFRVLVASGAQSEMDLSFAGLHQLLHPILDRAVQLPAPQRLALQSAFAVVDAAPPEPFLIALATLTLLAEVAGAEPLLLVVDEAHALDRPTTEVLAFVARRLSSDPIVLLAALRDGLESSLQDAGLPEMHVEALDDTASRRLLEEAAPHLAASVRRRLIAESLGNPLALTELSTTLIPAELSGEVELPDRLRLTQRLEQSYASRMSALSGTGRRLLLLAAADERGLVSDVLAAAADGAVEPSIEDFDDAVVAGLIVVDGPTVRFRHPLVRSAVYQSADDSECRAMHARLAAVLADDPDRRILHLALAARGPDEAVASDLEAAAERARRRGGAHVAVSLLERAATLSPVSAMRVSRRLRAAEMAIELGRNEMAARILSDVDPTTTTPRDQARILWLREFTEPPDEGHLERVRLLIETARGVLAAGDPELALNLLWACQLRSWRADPGPEIRGLLVSVTDTVPVAEDDPRVLAILATGAFPERGAKVLERLRRKVPASEVDPAAQRFLGMAATTIGDFVLAEAFLARAVTALRSQGRLALLAQALNLHAWTALHTKSLDLAAAHAEEGGRLARETAQPLWSAGTDVTLVHVAGMRGSEAEAEALATRAERNLSRTQGGDVLADLQVARGVAALCHGRHAEAFAHLRRIYDEGHPAFHPGYQAWAIGDYVEAAVLSGHDSEARRAMTQMDALAISAPSSRTQLAMSRARPWLARDAEADALYQTALGADLAPWPFVRGRLHLAYGEWLRRHRRVVDAREQLRIARDVFDSYGATHWGDRARRELRAAGEVSRIRAAHALDQLTPQELQIAQLAAQGNSNREIGAQLYLSHRTIAFHLYRVFPKLGVASRAELAVVLQGMSTEPAV